MKGGEAEESDAVCPSLFHICTRAGANYLPLASVKEGRNDDVWEGREAEVCDRDDG